MKDRTLFFLFLTCPIWIAYIIIGAFTFILLPDYFWNQVGFPIIYCTSCSFQIVMTFKAGLFYLPFMIIFGFILMKLENKGIKITIES